MKIYEFGTQNKVTLVFLHGGGLSWWNYREEAQLLEEKYHILLPVLDGHGDSDASFESIESCAKRILEFIETNLDGKVFALAGLSLGAQIAVEMLAQKPDVCQFALIESVSLIPSRLTNVFVAPSLSLSYFLIEKEWFSRLQFKSLRIQKSLYPDYYRDTCKIKKKDMISFLKANTAYSLPQNIRSTCAKIYVVVGEKEASKMKKSATLLVNSLQNSKLFVIQNMYHGEFSLNNPKRYVELFLELIG